MTVRIARQEARVSPAAAASLRLYRLALELTHQAASLQAAARDLVLAAAAEPAPPPGGRPELPPDPPASTSAATKPRATPTAAGRDRRAAVAMDTVLGSDRQRATEQATPRTGSVRSVTGSTRRRQLDLDAANSELATLRPAAREHLVF